MATTTSMRSAAILGARQHSQLHRPQKRQRLNQHLDQHLQQEQHSKRQRRECLLLKMPAEVRMMIYHYAFSGLKLHIRNARKESDEYRACFEQSSRGLLRTCRLIRMESLPLVYHDLALFCTYRTIREREHGLQWTDYPFYSRSAMLALQLATTVSIEREISTGYHSFGSMFKHCSRLQQIELCLVSIREFSQNIGHNRPKELQDSLDKACKAVTKRLLKVCLKKIAQRVRGDGLEEGNEHEEDYTGWYEAGDENESESESGESREMIEGFAVDKISMRPFDSCSHNGLLNFKTNTRFRICLDGAQAGGKGQRQ